MSLRLTALFLLLLLVSAARAQFLPAAGDGEHAWAALSGGEEATLTLWHHAPGDPPDRMRRVQQLRGKLMSGVALAAADGSLWIVYRDDSVQHVRAEPGAIVGHFTYHAARARQLPRDVRLRGLVADRIGPWALVTADNPATLAAIDAPPPDMFDDADELAIVLDMPEGVLDGLPRAREAEPVVEPPAGDDAPDAPAATHVDRLLRLSGGQWRTVALPDDWPHNARSTLLADPRGAGRPILLAQTTEEQPRRTVVAVYEPTGEAGWRRAAYDLGIRMRSAERWGAALVDGQVVLAQRNNTRLDLSVLRHGAAHALGTAELTQPDDAWTLLPAADAVAVMLAQPGDEPALAWTRIDLRGRVLHERTAITADPRAARAQRFEYAMMVAVIALSLLMLFVFWQRDPRLHQPKLDDKTRIAQLWRRTLAGVLDLLPGAVAVIVYYDITLTELQTHWRLRQIDPVEAEPAMVAIGLFVLYTLLGELVTGTTPGKRLLGLRVVTLENARPRAWQVVARGVLKAFDLVAPLLLVLPLLSPHRQRLGDLVARTLVVEPKEPQGQENQEEGR